MAASFSTTIPTFLWPAPVPNPEYHLMPVKLNSRRLCSAIEVTHPAIEENLSGREDSYGTGVLVLYSVSDLPQRGH
jgi:hypothetical protein